MIYIYNDFGGTHTTVMAASYHLKKLDETRVPTREEILTAHNFNELVYEDRGQLFFHGIDDEGFPVYTMGRGRSKVLIPGIINMIRMLQEENHLHTKIILSNTSPTVPFAMTIGGMLSRWLKIHIIGVPLLVIGAKQASSNIVRLVHKTKAMAKESDAQLVILENEEFN